VAKKKKFTSEDEWEEVVHYDRGVAYFKNGEYDKAIAEYNQAILLDPDYEEAKRNLEECERKR